MIAKHIKGKLRRIVRTREKIKKARGIRLSVFRSSRRFYAQLIDDAKAATLVSVSEKEIPDSSKKLTKSEKAKLLGQVIAEKAKRIKVTKVVFDRGGYKYHGRIKTFAESARENGLSF